MQYMAIRSSVSLEHPSKAGSRFTSKPDRKKLVTVIQQLQGLIGSAKSTARNDHDANRMENILNPLEEGVNLCVEAVRFNPLQVTR